MVNLNKDDNTESNNSTNKKSFSDSGLIESITYTVYTILYHGLIYGGAAFLIFWQDASLWLIVAAILAVESTHMSTEQWAVLFRKKNE